MESRKEELDDGSFTFLRDEGRRINEYRPPAQIQPTLRTARLVLRPFVECDAAEIARIFAPWEMAAMTRTIPHPYSLADAQAFLVRVKDVWAAGTSAVFAVVHNQSGALVGSIGLTIDSIDLRAEVGYSVDVRSWGKGYASEAVVEIVRFSFEELGLRKVTAHYTPLNPASARVLEKAGFIIEGRLRKQGNRWGQACDLIVVGLLREEWRRGEQAEH